MSLRKVLTIMLVAAVAAMTHAKAEMMTTDTLPNSIYEVPVGTMKAQGGTSETLKKYEGKVLLIVNVASHCGFTKQYDALEKLNKKYKDQGLQVLGFPCNDFHGQEPGTEEEIVNFCKAKYDVTFPLYAKLHTIGPEKAPLYLYLTSKQPALKGEVGWNFEKFLVSKDGKIIGRWKSKVKPDDPEVVAAIEKALQ